MVRSDDLLILFDGDFLNIFLFFLFYICNFLRVRVLCFCLDGLIIMFLIININYESLVILMVVVNVYVFDGIVFVILLLIIFIMDVNEVLVFGKIFY